MATIEARSSGPNAEEDTFVHDLKKIMEDGPNLNESLSNVHSGTSHKMDISSVNTSDIYNSNDQNLRIGVTFPNSQPMPPANTNVPLSLPQRNGETPSKPSLVKSQSKIDNIKQWGISTYKCTRQILSERFGKASKTVDLELEAQIEVLRDTQKKYANILRLARALTSNFYHVVQTQRALGEAFSDLAQKSPELHEEFSYNAETQRVLCKSGETLLSALNFFTSSVNTLCNKTIEDTLTTIKLYETARVEYDAYRSDLEFLGTSPRTDATITRLRDTQDVYQYHKERFDRLRQDVTVKLRFLDENKVKVMHKQLLLFHNAISAYFSGNQSALEATLKQFNIKLKPPNAEGASWLEQ